MIVHPAAPSFKELPKQTEKGAFQEDSYYRINVIPIKIPLLRKKSEDIPPGNYILFGMCVASKLIE